MPLTNVWLQTFNGEALLELIKKLVQMDKHWIPKEPSHSLYIRPTLSTKFDLSVNYDAEII